MPGLAEQGTIFLARRYLSNSSAHISKGIVEIALRNAKDPIAVLMELEQEASVPSADIVNALDKLVGERSRAISAMFIDISTSSAKTLAFIRPEIGAWLWLNQIDYNGQTVSALELASTFEHFRLFDSTRRARFEHTTLAVLIKSEHIALLEDFFSKSQFFSFASLRTKHKAGLLRLALKAQPSSYAKMKAKLVVKNGLEQLKLGEIDALQGINSSITHEAQFESLMGCAPTGIVEELQIYVAPVYKKYQSQMNFIDVRVNRQQRIDLMGLFKESLVEKKSFSLIRLGDGESYIWDHSDNIATTEDQELREQQWWGGVLDPEIRAKLRNQLQESVKAANMIGLPSAYRFTRDTDTTLRNLKSRHLGRGLLTVMQRVPDVITKSVILTEERVHQVLFSKETICELVQHANRLIVVSSVKKEAVLAITKDWIDSENVTVIEIPTHARTLSNNSFIEGTKALPHCYGEILEQLKGHSGPGTLSLVAAGIIGKIFISKLAGQGGVALDIGTAVDYWVGAKTRSYEDIV